jgi:hypothetical protein
MASQQLPPTRDCYAINMSCDSKSRREEFDLFDSYCIYLQTLLLSERVEQKFWSGFRWIGSTRALTAYLCTYVPKYLGYVSSNI